MRVLSPTGGGYPPLAGSPEVHAMRTPRPLAAVLAPSSWPWPRSCAAERGGAAEGAEGAGRPRVPAGRPSRGRPRLARGRRARRPAHVLRRHRLGRRVEVHGRRDPVEAGLRRPARRARSARSRWRRPTRTSSTSARARPTSAATSPRATASTSPPTPGKTWQHVWKQDGQIGTMVVHPKNPDVAYAAVLGKPFGPNPERGVYRTRDGGKTWERVLYVGRGHRRLRRGARPARTRASSSPASGRRGAGPGSW